MAQVRVTVPGRRVMTGAGNAPRLSGVPQARGAEVTGQAAGELFNGLSKATSEFAARAKNASDAIAVAKADQDAALKWDKFFRERSSDATGWHTLESDSEAAINEIGKAITDGVSDPTLRGKIEVGLSKKRTQWIVDARQKARQQQLQYATSGTEEVVTGYERMAADPSKEAEATKRASDILQLQVKAGAISPDKAVIRLRKFSANVTAAKVRRMIVNDPEQAESLLSDPSNFPGLGEEKTAVLFKQATASADRARAERIRLADKAERDAESGLKDDQKANFTLYMDQIREHGEVPEIELRKARDDRTISPGDYERLIAANREGVDNPATTDYLDGLVYSGRAEMSDIFEAKAHDGLSRSSMQAYMSALSEYHFTKTPDYREARDYVESTLGVVSKGFFGGGGSANRKTADALYELYNRVKDGEKPLAIVQDVIGHYQLGETRIEKRDLPVPRIMVKDSGGTIDVKASEDRILAETPNDALANQRLMELHNWVNAGGKPR